MTKIIIQGIKFDKKSSYQKGPKLAPPLIREALNCGSTNMYTENLISIENSGIDDKGDFEISEYFDIEKLTKNHLNFGAKVFTLGGDHSVTFPILKAYNEKHPKLTFYILMLIVIYMINLKEINTRTRVLSQELWKTDMPLS